MIQLIQTAALSDSGNRQQAQNTIVSLREQNPPEFIQQVSAVLINTQVPDHTRQAAGTILAVSFKHKNNEGKYVWDCIDANFKAMLKGSILGVLIDQSKNVRRSAANIVASICSIQLPRNQWEGIVEKICENIRHQNPIVKQASILTLGFICEIMKDKTNFKFNYQHQENIMAAILLGLQQQDHNLIETALKALRNSISTFHEILSVQQPREYILKQIVNTINNGKYLIQGLQILGQFVKSAYQSLGPYLENICVILAPIVSKTNTEDDYDTCVSAMEVFQNIAEYFKDQNQNGTLINYITGQIGQNIVTLLLKNLIIVDDADKIDENPVAESASKALQSIFESGSQEYKELVLGFVSNCMKQNNWKYQQASIKAFSLLLFGLPQQQNQQLISTSFNQLIQLLNHDSLQVKYVTFDSLVIITEICGEIVLKSEFFVDYLTLITSKINMSQSFMQKACKIIENLCEAEKYMKLGKFNTIADHLIEFLLKICIDDNTPISNVDWAVEAIMGIIQVIENAQVSLKYLNFALDNFDNIKNINNHQKKQQLYSVFFTIMQYSLHSLKGANIEITILNNVYNKSVGHFQAINDVTADGLYAVQALVPFFSQDLRLVEDFWKYIMHALNKWQDNTLLKAALSCITFFTSCYGESFGPKIIEFFPKMVSLVQDPTFNRETKLDIIIFLGQIFLNCGQAALPFLEDFMKVIMMCCQAAINLQTSDLQYSQNLKDIIIESVKCVIHGLSEYPKTKEIMNNYTQHIFKFVQITSSKQNKPTVKYVNQCIWLLGDYTKFFPSLAAPYKNQQFIKECMGILNKFDHSGEYKQSLRYAKMLFG